jgi:rhodanese-related sulfurtransferase
MRYLAILAICLTAAVAHAGDQDISVEALHEAIQNDAVTVIDVNGTQSYVDGHVPGAINWEAAHENLAEHLPEDKDALIVAYCGGPSCGAYKAAVKKAQELGYTNVHHMSAGIAGWKQADMPVEKAEEAKADKADKAAKDV